jgi:hypothetical protein
MGALYVVQLTRTELPNYRDVVIPRTELYYRHKIEERVDISVEIHLWRRQLVVLKQFKFDILTRDNISLFKKEVHCPQSTLCTFKSYEVSCVCVMWNVCCHAGEHSQASATRKHRAVLRCVHKPTHDGHSYGILSER